MPKHPYYIKLSKAQRAELVTRLVGDLRAGIRSRSAHIDEAGIIDFCYALYRQQPMQATSHRDAARSGEPNLTSPIATENVDALTARTVQTIFRQEPVFMVDGDAQSAHKAPVVEAFIQMRQEKMRFQKTAKRGITAAYVETGAILEVCEDAEPVRCHRVIKAQPMLADDGVSLLLGEDGQPVPRVDEDGVPLPADLTQTQDYVDVNHTWTEYHRQGSYVRVRGMKDFLFLPSHAADDREVWGHATRFYCRVDEAKRRFDSGEWGPDAGGITWDELAPDGVQEREQRAEQDRAGVTVETANGHESSTELELWRVQCWIEIPGQDGLCCVQTVVSEKHSSLFQLIYDWIGAYRTVYLNPYPSSESVYGLSLVGDKLLTIIEEHTSWRNMNAYRSTLKSRAPLKRRSGSRWDPSMQAFGPDAVLDMDNMDDVQPFEFDDVTAQAMQKEQQCVIDAQRVVGMNDIAIGQVSEKSRTLGENKMATSQSFVRTDDPISNIQEALEEVGWLIHRIEVQALRDRGTSVPAPARMADQLAQSVEGFQGQFTAEMLDGEFTFKPRGSSDQSDPAMRFRRMDMRIATMERAAKYNPAIAQRLASPEFANSLMQDLVAETKPRDVAAYLKALPPPPQPPMGPGAPPMGAGPGGPPGGPAPSVGAGVLQGLMAQLPPQGGVQ